MGLKIRVPKLKSRQTYWNFVHEPTWRSWIRIWSWYLKILYLNSEVEQIGVEIKISSDLFENECTSQFEGTSKYEVILSEFITLALPPFPEIIKKYRFSTEIEFFLITVLAKLSILDAWQGSEYANEYC